MNSNEFNSKIKSAGQKLLQDQYIYLDSKVKTDNLEFFTCLKINSKSNLQNNDLALKDLRLLLIAQFLSKFLGKKYR